MGQTQSKPLLFQWRWYYGLPNVLPWALALVVLLLRKRNRTGQAWLILLPLVIVALVWRMPLRLVGAPADFEQALGVAVMSLAGGWAAVWLLGDWIARRTWVTRQIIAIGIIILAGALGYVSQFGLAVGEELAEAAILLGFSALTLLAAMGLTARACRRAYRPGAFMGWLALWCVLVPATALFLVVFTIAVAVSVAEGNVSVFVGMILAVVLGTPLFGGLSYLMNLPFMILAFKSPFWRQRFRDTFGLNRASEDDLEVLPPLSPFAEPVSTDPTGSPVVMDDVAGAWQFYLDELSRSVVVDFNPDGTFSQTITTNWGEATECPGGTWRLEGPMIHLSGYATVRQGTGVDRTWWMIDTPSGLAMFGGDNPKPDAFFRMTRLQTDVEGHA